MFAAPSRVDEALSVTAAGPLLGFLAGSEPSSAGRPSPSPQPQVLPLLRVDAMIQLNVPSLPPSLPFFLPSLLPSLPQIFEHLSQMIEQ